MDPPITAASRPIPRESSSARSASTMSAIVTMGNDNPYGFPVLGSREAGPVDPMHPPITFEQTTK